jgi:hypothetical protein
LFFSCYLGIFDENKSEVFDCIKDFHMSIHTQYGAVVKVLRSDNGTEYTNRIFRDYLSAQGIYHRTTCPYTPTQNESDYMSIHTDSEWSSRKKEQTSPRGS